MQRKRVTPVSVTVSPEWGVYPLWIEHARGELRDNSSPESLVEYGVDRVLISSIDSWDESYQAVYDPNDLVDSGFETEYQTQSWVAEGIALTRALSSQLPPGVVVKFRMLGRELHLTAPSEVEGSAG